MPNSIESAVQTMVADAVQAALAPYADILTRFQALMAPGAARRGPGRPPKAAGVAVVASVKVRAKRGRKAKRAKAALSVNTFKAGDAVAYKQGRGTFQATVVELDEPTGLLVLERAADGKRVLRKPATIEATGAAPVIEAKVEAKPKPAKKAKPGRKAKAPRAAKEAKAAKAEKPAKAKRQASAEAVPAVRINLTEGQLVVYRQGKGAFKAKVAGIDEAKGTVTLARASDGKKVTRPAAKVQPTEE